jgi:hypothetical protein
MMDERLNAWNRHSHVVVTSVPEGYCPSSDQGFCPVYQLLLSVHYERGFGNCLLTQIKANNRRRGIFV